MALPPGIDPAEEERRRRAQEQGDDGGILDGLADAGEAASGCLPDVGGCIPDGCGGCSIDLIALTAIAGLGVLLLR